MFTTPQLQKSAQQARCDALTMIYQAGSGHPGGSLSAIDLLVWLYFVEMSYRADNPAWPYRDRFVLSKGHACPALYAVAVQACLLDKAQLSSFRKLNSRLQGHPHVGDLAWVETSTGSLAQGFSAALGMALGLRHQRIDADTYVMLGDGEMQEGEIWEGAMFAAHHALHHLCAILDFNKMQSDDLNVNIMNIDPIVQKWEAFGWAVKEIDGHDFNQIEAAFNFFNQQQSQPTLIVAHTLKGKGVSYMEGVPSWHGSVKMSNANIRDALADLGLGSAEVSSYMDGSAWEASS